MKNFSLLPLTQASKQTSWCTRWYFAFVDDCLFMSCWILKFIFNKFLTLRAASKVVEKVLSALKLINIWIYFQNELLKKSVFYFTLRFSNKEFKKPRKTLIFFEFSWKNFKIIFSLKTLKFALVFVNQSLQTLAEIQTLYSYPYRIHIHHKHFLKHMLKNISFNRKRQCDMILKISNITREFTFTRLTMQT